MDKNVRRRQRRSGWLGIIFRLAFLGTNNIVVNYNLIENNTNGVNIKGFFTGSNDNFILNNNFIKNGKDAFFNILSINNKWHANYWNRPRILPKPIIGSIISNIPWINFDWRPALLPYEL